MSADGCYSAAHAAINPHLWKGQFNTRNQWDRRGNKKTRHQCGGYWTLTKYKQSFFPRGAKTERTQRRHITSKREKQINSCPSFFFFSSGVCKSSSLGRVEGVQFVFLEEASVSGSCEVSFASANETALGWPVSPWQQAISTSLSAILAAMVVCLLVSLHPASLHPSTVGLISTTVAAATSVYLTRPIGLRVSLNLSLRLSNRDKSNIMKDECPRLLWVSQWFWLKANNWQL